MSLSPFVRQVRPVLAIKGIDYERVIVTPGARSVLGGESRARRRLAHAAEWPGPAAFVDRLHSHPQLAAIVEEERAMPANA